MGFNLVGLAENLFEQIDTYVEVVFILDGERYEVESFNIVFTQAVDHKGQPQHETKGGQLSITLTQSVGDNIYDWAKREKKRKDGQVLFISKTIGTVLNISFINADCIKLTRKINAFDGTKTMLIIAPEKVSLNGITHDNKWREE